MADSGSDRERGSDDDEDESPDGIDPCDLSALSDKDRKKWQKNCDKWQLFVDFLFRHIAIATFKYNCFEREQLTDFMRSLEKAETLRAQGPLKKGKVARVGCFKDMVEAATLLEQLRHNADAERLRQLLDLTGRMRCIAMIASGFVKTLKKGNVRGMDRIKYLLDHWRGLCVRSYDFAELRLRNADLSTLDSLERRYLVWSAVVRTCIHVAQQFLKKTCEATGLDLIHDDPRVMQQHMRAAEFVLAARLDELLVRRTTKDSNDLPLGAAILGPRPMQVLGGGRQRDWSLPNVRDVDAELIQPIPDDDTTALMPNKAYDIGSTITMTCSIDKDETLIWKKAVPHSNPLHIALNGVVNDTKLHKVDYTSKPTKTVSSLTILKATRETPGRYECQLADGHRHDFSHVVVIVHPITCRSNATSGQIIAGTYVFIECVINYKGNFTPVITLHGLQPGTLVKGNDLITLHHSITYTALVLITPEYDGVTITAKAGFSAIHDVQPPYESRDTIRPMTVFYSVRDLDYKPRKSSYKIGDKLTLTADGNPKPSYEWFFMQGVQSIRGANLTITDNMVGDGQKFRIRAYNDIRMKTSGRQTEEKRVIKLNIKPPPTKKTTTTTTTSTTTTTTTTTTRPPTTMSEIASTEGEMITVESITEKSDEHKWLRLLLVLLAGILSIFFLIAALCCWLKKFRKDEGSSRSKSSKGGKLFDVSIQKQRFKSRTKRHR